MCFYFILGYKLKLNLVLVIILFLYVLILSLLIGFKNKLLSNISRKNIKYQLSG